MYFLDVVCVYNCPAHNAFHTSFGLSVFIPLTRMAY